MRPALLEAGRRTLVALRRRRERAALGALSRVERGPARARLAPEFARLGGAELLEHFRTRTTPRLPAGFEEAETGSAGSCLARNVEGILKEARAVAAHRWPLLGYGVREFGARVDWLREPASGVEWPLDFHADVQLVRGGGSDVRVLWELNRLGHLVTLARAYAAGGGEGLAEEFFAQVETWAARNPAGFGPNWACAMEVSLRAVNLLAAFRLFRRSPAMNDERLAALLALFDAHGRHVRRNLEYSYIATGNHYLSDVAGLVWLGVCLPELAAAEGWRVFGVRELTRELERQVLPDGADWESSTGYHRFALELFLYTFVLCRENGIEIEERHFLRVRSMLEYLRAYLRPDGRAPLVGDTDGGRFLPLVWRAADDHAYLLAVGAAVFREPRFKLPGGAPEEVFWLTGAGGLQTYEGLEAAALSSSASEVFEHAGACVLREGDLYLMLNASGAGLAGRGAHGHNDALSIEVSACGVSFISDPGTYVYTGDPRARHEFRSTAYHSTVGVDGAEQNTISVDTPFIIGDEARPRVLAFYSDGGRATTCAEHVGYERLAAGPVTHRRSVHFDGRGRFWLVRDSLIDEGEHEHEQEYEHGHDFRFVFHAAPGRLVRTLDARGAGVPDGCAVEVADAATGARLLVVSLEGLGGVAVEPRWASREYGSRVETAAAVWTTRAPVPLVASWLLVPVCAGEEAAARLELALKSVAELMDESGESGG
ncbi:MAG: alginate lyase family protein [Pyrinomonadaceae bacterium]